MSDPTLPVPGPIPGPRARPNAPSDPRSGRRPRPRRTRRRVLTAIITVVAVLALVLGAWAVDAQASSGKVARGITVAGQPVGGDTPTELTAATAKVADAYKGAEVQITSPEGDLVATAAGVGLTLDQPQTIAATLAIDADGGTIKKPFKWARSLLSARATPLAFTVDSNQLAIGITELAKANRIDPVEPNITITDTGVETVAGAKGAAVDVGELAAELKAQAETGVTPIKVHITAKPINPRFSDGDAKALVTKANSITKTPLALSIGGKSATIPTKTLRSWLTAAAGPTSLDLQFDQAKIVAELPKIVGGVGTAPTQVGFSVDEDPATHSGPVTIIDGTNGTKCCAPDSGQRIAAALAAGQTTVALDVEPVAPDHDHAWAESLKIVEPIASFTTPHPCCAARVTNIHKFADIVRGMYIEPGATFSTNDRVGQRTADRGFVDAPVIYNAVEDHDIGGGVSQFATTLFNAAFFGGLDYEEYQSHSEFIDRYPYGREATISWPKPDLKIKNTTPYGVLIWPSYTDTSLTVTLYSTKFATGAQTGQTKAPDGDCTKVSTERTRTYVSDGHTAVDHVVAIYQPAAGVHCP